MTNQASHFDREQKLGDLLPISEGEKLCSSLSIILDSPIAIIDLTGDTVAGARGLNHDNGEPLVLELEPIGYLLAPTTTPVQRVATAAMIRQLLTARARYRIASSAHIASVQADYEELARQNEALSASEAKYRALSEELEERVASQIKLIDDRQRQLYQAERLVSVGQLAAGIAHEINNPIGFVRSNLTTAQNYVGKIADLKPGLETLSDAKDLWKTSDMDFILEDFVDLLNDSISGVDRVARIVKDLKGFSNIDRPNEEVVDLSTLLETTCSIISTQLPQGAQLIRDLPPLKPTLCLPGHLSQAFLNLLNNARQAIRDKGTDGVIEVRSRLEGDTFEITVADNGEGITEENLNRVFDPFFTTRPVGQGSGLGLTVARDIIGAHGGTIFIESNPNNTPDGTGTHGTKVTIQLPD